MRWNLTDRREEPRFPVETPVCVEVVNGPTCFGEIRDISDHGLRVSMEGVPLRSSDRIRIRFFDQQLAGTVRHCRRTADLRFEVGLKLDQPVTDPQMDALLAEAALA